MDKVIKMAQKRNANCINSRNARERKKQKIDELTKYQENTNKIIVQIKNIIDSTQKWMGELNVVIPMAGRGSRHDYIHFRNR